MSYIDGNLMSSAYDNQNNLRLQTQGVNDTNMNVEDMFLTLDSDLTEDFEKMKRIASDVQHYCIPADELSKNIITDASIKAIPIGTTSIQLQDTISSTNRSLDNKTKVDVLNKAPRPSKKYKRLSNNNRNNHNNNCNINDNDNNNNHINNNSDNSNNASNSSINNNDNNNNLNVTNNNTIPSNHNSINVGPSNIQQQRKERSLHYCSICSKGFKDKYSVNVHHRTHTGKIKL